MSKIILIHKKNNKHEFIQYSKRIIAAKTTTLCAKKVNEDFLRDSVQEADYLFINQTQGEIRGFACVYHDGYGGKHLHISLICNSTPHNMITRKNITTISGKKIIDNIISYGKKIKVKNVHLDAIKEVIPYYYKLGFSFEHAHYNKEEEKRLVNELRNAQLKKDKKETKQILQKIVLKFYTGYFKEKMQHDMGKDDGSRIKYAMEFGIPMKYVFKNQSICKGKSVKLPNKCRKHKTCKVANGRKRTFCRTIKNTTRRSGHSTKKENKS